MINWADADCHYGDHFWQKNFRCSNCHAFNGGLFSYVGNLAKAAKKAGMTVPEYLDEQQKEEDKCYISY